MARHYSVASSSTRSQEPGAAGTSARTFAFPLARTGVTRRQLIAGAAAAAAVLGFSSMVPGAAHAATAGSSSDYVPSFKAGTYTGTGEGNGGDITADVTFSDSKIESIKITSQSETPAVSGDFTDPDMPGALTQLPEDIVKYQSLGVDSISGATATSMGIKQAVSDAVTQAGGDADAMANLPGAPKTDAQQTLSADAIVVGAGGAGMSAAIRLLELGKSVIMVEKTYRLGGCISVSGGNQVVCGSQLQQQAGVTDDTPESMVEDFQANGEGQCVPELIDLYANNVGATTDWLNQDLGVQYNMQTGLHQLAEYSHNRELAYDGGGFQAAKTLRSKVYALGADVLLNTRATDLLVTDGAVSGVKATGNDGTTYTINAPDVVLATGGYGASSDWLSADAQNYLYYGPYSSTGDGLTMATAAGVDAATRMLEYVKLYPNGVEVSPHRAKSTIDGNLVVWPMSAILVSPEGERVVNEKASNHDILEVELQQTNQELFLLMDAANWEAWYAKLPGTGFNMKHVQEYLDANGSSTPVFAHADTIAELAPLVGMDPDTLQATVDKYNNGVQTGVDEFGRSGDNLKMTIGDGPYYLVEQKPRYATSMGGVVVNTSLQVQNEGGQTIPGLYGVGEFVGGVMGTNSPSGANNGWALTSGKLAAEAIAGTAASAKAPAATASSTKDASAAAGKATASTSAKADKAASAKAGSASSAADAAASSDGTVSAHTSAAADGKKAA